MPRVEATGLWNLSNIPVWIQSWQIRNSTRRCAYHTSLRTESRSLNIVQLEADVSLAALLSPLVFTKATKKHLWQLRTSETSLLSTHKMSFMSITAEHAPCWQHLQFSVKSGDRVSCDPQMRLLECNVNILCWSCWVVKRNCEIILTVNSKIQ